MTRVPPPQPPAGPGTGLTGTTTMLLIAAGRAAQRRLEAALAEHGLTLRHVGALGHLAHTDGLTYSDLARRARMTPQSMQATMIQLAERGAIDIETRGRAAYPKLTDAGRQLLATAARIAQRQDQTLAASQANTPSLRAALDHIVRQSFDDRGESADTDQPAG